MTMLSLSCRTYPMPNLRQTSPLAESTVRDSIVRLDTWGDVSCFGFPVGVTGQACPEWLSAEEHDRSKRIEPVAARGRFLVARCALRVLLADLLGRRPQEVRIDISLAGKPFLPGHPLHFSLSHCGDWGAVAISTSHEVGIDIEAPRKLRYPSRFDQRLPNIPDLDLLARWTLAESALKSLGLGVHAIGGLVVADQIDVETLLAHGKMKSRARPLDFLPCPTYSAAVALRTDIETVFEAVGNATTLLPSGLASYPTC